MWVAAKNQIAIVAKRCVKVKKGDPMLWVNDWPNPADMERIGLIRWQDDGQSLPAPKRKYTRRAQPHVMELFRQPE